MLPQDIILMICEELGLQADFGTLYNLALSGRLFAGSALLWMYRVHNQSSIRGGENDQTEMSKIGDYNDTTPAARNAQQKQTISRWSLHWRSIVLSSLGKTLYPYCLYIRSLDLDNLGDLLEDLIRRDRVYREHSHDDFFKGDMQIFTSKNRSTRSHLARLPTNSTVESVAESISKYVSDKASEAGGSATLEELRCRLPRATLPICVARLSRLKEMHIYDGAVLDETTAAVLQTHCPSFERLNLYVCQGDEVDSDLASFLSGLRSNSLHSFHVISRNDIAVQTLVAMNCHRETLGELWLGDLSVPGMQALSLLGSCTAINSLKISTVAGTLDLEATENDTYLGIVAWLTSCRNLKELELMAFKNGPSILTAICLESSIHLTRLSLKQYTLVNNQVFHQALAQQTSLVSLELIAFAEDATRDDIDTLVSSLCNLSNLKYLDIPDISNDFRSAEVERLALSLPKLESFSVGGSDIDDNVWRCLGSLHHLKQMTFYAFTTFTYRRILRFVEDLRDTNAGFSLNIMSAMIESDLTPHEIENIKQQLSRKLGGTFVHTLYREAESDLDSDSD